MGGLQELRTAPRRPGLQTVSQGISARAAALRCNHAKPLLVEAS